MFEFHVVVEFRRFFGRQGRRFFLVDQICNVIPSLLRRLEPRNGVWSRSGCDKLNDFVICSNHFVIVLSRNRRANALASTAEYGKDCEAEKKRLAQPGRRG